MTEVVYEPRKRVIIHEYSYYDSVEDLIIGAFGNAPPGSNIGPLKWVDGIVLTHSALPMTDSVTKEILEGKLHWNHVSFAPMEEYVSNLHLSDSRITVNIINVSANLIFTNIATFLKENLMK